MCINLSDDIGEFALEIKENEFEEGEFDLELKDHNLNHQFPCFKAKIAPLWVAQAERFSEGDYYQKIFNKENMVAVRRDVSYGAVVHRLLVSNSESIPFIKKIFSTSLIGDETEGFISLPAINFWNIQLNNPAIPVHYSRQARRYYLIVND